MVLDAGTVEADHVMPETHHGLDVRDVQPKMVNP
jgi:hypothetical protein